MFHCKRYKPSNSIPLEKKYRKTGKKIMAKLKRIMVFITLFEWASSFIILQVMKMIFIITGYIRYFPLWFEFPQNWTYSKHLFFYLNFLFKQTRFPFKYNLLMTYQWKCLNRFQSPITMIFNKFSNLLRRSSAILNASCTWNESANAINRQLVLQWYTVKVQHTAACKSLNINL